MKRNGWILAFPVMVAASAFTMAHADDPPIAISDNPQLFLDDYLIRDMRNLERVMVQPEKHTGNPVIVPEHPWEKRILEIYGTVLYDESREQFRCWYLANEFKDGIPDNPEYPQTAEYYTCYAESADGIHWSKPMVGREPFGRHEKHNVIIEGTHGFCVLPTPDDPDPSKRYKGAGGASVGESPDGLTWSVRNWRDAVGKNDTSTCVVQWNGEYLAYVRAQVPDPDWPAVMRGVGLSVSTHFLEWTPKETVFTTDKEDGYPWTQPYGISVTPFGDVLIGILWLLHLDEVEGNNSEGHMDTQLVVSRDGRRWVRVANRAPFLSPTPGTWDAGRVFPGTTLFRRDGKIWIYYTGVSTRHGEGWGEMGIGLATLPEDRFVGLRVREGATNGVLETHCLSFEGNELVINADVAESGLAVELTNAEGNVIQGAGRDSSHLIREDPLRYRVAWRDGDTERSLGDLTQGRPVSIRFLLENSTVYGFQIHDSKH
ncbi:MAG: hypothetical protein KJ060_07000 [Candidatus Hydrogenedentes bacterium]|nr:hypothetical protein [Candidatus Hydrogenedentota bacterium]